MSNLTGDLQYPSAVSRTLLPDQNGVLKSLIRVIGQHDHQLTDADINLLQDLASLRGRRVLSDTSTSGVLTWQPMTFPAATQIFILSSVAASSGNVAVYNGIIGSNFANYVGQYFTVSGFAGANNNSAVPLYCSAASATSITLSNAVATAETNPAVAAIGNTFSVPGFDVLFNGEAVSISGNLSNDLLINNVVLPAPQFWTLGSTAPQAQIYIVFLELWYANLNPATGQGYYLDPSNNQLRFFYPLGCKTPGVSNLELIPDDAIDPFQNLNTTQRAQIQWALRVQPVALTYDFTQYRFGLDPGATVAETVYAQGGSVAPVVGNPTYQFTNMGSINGDTGLWRAGDGNVNNSLVSMDGYSYAMPVAVVFQRNTGPFTVINNPLGCASSTSGINNSGLISSGDSGRYDFKYADAIYQSDTIDTRCTVQLDGYNFPTICGESFVDLVAGATQCKIGRGESPGNLSIAAGSVLEYYVSMNGVAIANTDTVGSFDGFANGFSSDQRTYNSVVQVSTNQKSVGIIGGNWKIGDAFTIALPAISQAVIQNVLVQALVTQPDNSLSPVLLLPGQLSIVGLGTKTVTVSFITNLQNTAYDPTNNNIYVTVGAEYAAGSGLDLRKVPVIVNGGTLYDGASGATLPVYGISEYDITAQQVSLNSDQIVSYNPEFSNVVFGTRISVQVSGALGVLSNVGGNPITTFILNRSNLVGQLDALYCISAVDSVSGISYPVNTRSITTAQTVVAIQGTVPNTSTVIFTLLAQATCQAAYNAPVKGITEIEETVLVGNWTSDSTLPMDSRVSIASNTFSPTNGNTLVLAASGCILKGISGDDSNQFIFVQDTTGTFNAVQVASVSFNSGLVVVNVPNTVNLLVQPFFFCASILPALAPASTLIVVESYIPYQGEGFLNRDYEFVYTDDNCLVTTNGTGKAPVVGLQDVYPYNRELPISTSLPSLVTWPDSTLVNSPVNSFFDSNYVTKQYENVEHTFEVPQHTNDWIDPYNKDKRKTLRFTSAGGQRGFSRGTPNIGFGVAPIATKTVLSEANASTVAPVILYVNNVTGSDVNDGLSQQLPKFSISSALASLPPVLRHPCSVQLIPTGVPYSLTSIYNAGNMVTVALGDGEIVSSKYYAVGSCAFSIQESGRLVISIVSGATGTVVFDATGYVSPGDGPTAAFFVDNTRVIFNQLTFQGFSQPAVKGQESNIEFVNCDFKNNVQSGSFEECSVTITGGTITLPDGGVGHVGTISDIVVSGVNFAVAANANPGPFFVPERGSSLTLQNHAANANNETNIVATTPIVVASLNSNVVTENTFQSSGSATLIAISVLQRTVSINPFIGGVTADSSSSVLTSLS